MAVQAAVADRLAATPLSVDGVLWMVLPAAIGVVHAPFQAGVGAVEQRLPQRVQGQLVGIVELLITVLAEACQTGLGEEQHDRSGLVGVGVGVALPFPGSA